MQKPRVDHARALLRAQIADSINAARQRDEGGQAHDQSAERVRAQESAEGFDSSAREDIRAEPCGEDGDDGEGQQVNPLDDSALAQRPAGEAAEQRHEHKERE